MTSKKDVYVHFDVILSEVRPRHHPAALPTPPLSARFYCYYRPPESRSLPGCGPQSSSTPVRISISFWSRAMQSVGVAVSQLGPFSRSLSESEVQLYLTRFVTPPVIAVRFGLMVLLSVYSILVVQKENTIGGQFVS
jgi:hypothetical protein